MKRVRTPAYLLRLSPFGESDAVATFLTEETGKVSAIARGAKRSTKRFGGALEPMHLLAIEYEDRGKELVTLKEASLLRTRLGLTGSLEALEAAGTGLRWTRALCPARTPEPDAFAALTDLLDGVDAGGPPRATLAAFGLQLLVATGFGLALDECVQCGRPCPPDRPACVDVARGGIVCMDCGGARVVVDKQVRAKAARAAKGEPVDFTPSEAEAAIRLVELGLAAHAEVES